MTTHPGRRRTPLRRTLLRALALPLVAPVLALALVACAGDEETADGLTDASPTAATEDETATPAVTPADADPDATPTVAGASEGLEELTARLERAQDAEYQVTYDIAAEAQGQTVSGTATWYRSAERFRSDLSVEQAGTALDVVTISTPEATYFCSDLEGTERCMELPPGETGGAFSDPLEPVALQLEALSDAENGFNVTIADERTIAGEQATCFDFESGAGPTAGEGTTCLSEEGVLLFMEFTTSGGTTTLEATEFSSEVGGDAFEPPFPVS